MYLIVLSSPPPVKKIKDETRCLCLKDKAQAVCYGQTLASWQGKEERRRGCSTMWRHHHSGTDRNPAQTHTHTCCTQPLKSQMGELQKVQQHINKSLRENLFSGSLTCALRDRRPWCASIVLSAGQVFGDKYGDKVSVRAWCQEKYYVLSFTYITRKTENLHDLSRRLQVKCSCVGQMNQNKDVITYLWATIPGF